MACCIKKTVESILAQTFPIQRIIVNIPMISKKGQAYCEVSIGQLEKLAHSSNNVIIINRACGDIGPITKLMHTLKYAPAGSLLSLCDDDVIYEPENIALMVNAYTQQTIENFNQYKNPYRHVDGISYACRLGSSLMNQFYTPSMMRCDVLETFAGVLYRRDAFDNSFASWVSNLDNELLWTDDIVIAAWLSKSNQMYMIHSKRFHCKHELRDTPELRDANLRLFRIGDGRNQLSFKHFCSIGYFKHARPTSFFENISNLIKQCWRKVSS
jgi:glycosyltransferase involved in cell wall biosynthesis